jgi:hypothetical protein
VDQFGIDGVFGHWESTATGIIGIAASLGLISSAHAAGYTAFIPIIGQYLPTIIAGAGALVSLAKIFFKGPAPAAPPNPTANP